jgi:UDP-N-acetylglucosamine 2-epimerase
MVIGNSSSGIIEAPSFKIPTVNIGNRQLGRIRAKSVIDCGSTTDDISAAIVEAKRLLIEKLLNDMKNPYEKNDTSESILSEIRKYLMQKERVEKRFYDILI